MPDTATLAFRFGFGLPLPKGTAVQPAAMVEALTKPDKMRTRFPSVTSDQHFPIMEQIQTAIKQRRRGTPAEAEEGTKAIRALNQQIQRMTESAFRSILARALDSPDGFRERLVLFWGDHFTTNARVPYTRLLPYAMLDEAIRPHLAGNFEDLLAAAILHPAMLAYLDQSDSVGPNSRFGKRKGKGLNENLARELMELHTMGAGSGYTQTDVRELAELLTGIVVGKDGVRFLPVRAEPGAETVLGVTYDGPNAEPIRAVLRDLAHRPETAHHIAHKLAVHFISDTPDASLVQAVSQTFLQSGGHLPSVYQTLLDHPAAWTGPAAKARQPFEFVVCSLRALGLTGDDVMGMDDRTLRRTIIAPLRQMGQPFLGAPGPDGWPEALERWLNPPGLAARITWSMTAPARLFPTLPEPVDFMERAIGPRASAALQWAVPKAETRQSGIGLVLSSPEFNRR